MAWAEEEGQMKPEAKCSSRNLHRASNSEVEREYRFPRGGWVPSSSSILRSYSWCGARVLALLLLNTSANLWYEGGMAERSTGSEVVAYPGEVVQAEGDRTIEMSGPSKSRGAQKIDVRSLSRNALEIRSRIAYGQSGYHSCGG